jgi:superfamily II DNA or RNA helicase
MFLVADEVHRLGAPQARNVFTLDSGPRLGLSATPERAGDHIGTQAILSYFEGIVPPPFTLFDAIASGTLTPYAYHVHTISLEQDEQAQWDDMTSEIRRVYAQSKSEDIDVPQEYLKRLLIRRARIVKNAHQKVGMAVTLLTDTYRPGNHWIVYCDDRRQLFAVSSGLRAAGCSDVLEYHSAMTGDARRTLDLFEERGGVVVSIRCLDEGVDIPSASHALILASSKNPREYVQRRGRLLRRAPGKSLAHIYDVVVTPTFNPNEMPATAILEGELARAIEFGRHAINPSCITDLERLAIEHGLDLKVLFNSGYEDDDYNDSKNEGTNE